MGLEKEGYRPALHGTLTLSTPIDVNGNIITDDETTPAKEKNLRFTRANAENSAAENYAVLNALVTMTGGSTTYQSNTFNVKWGM